MIKIQYHTSPYSVCMYYLVHHTSVVQRHNMKLVSLPIIYQHQNWNMNCQKICHFPLKISVILRILIYYFLPYQIHSQSLSGFFWDINEYWSQWIILFKQKSWAKVSPTFNTLYVVFYKWQCFYFGHVARRALRTIPEILKNTCYGLMATFDLFEIDIREIP